MRISIRNIEKSELSEGAYLRLVEHFCQELKLKKDVSISFDDRLTCYGLSYFDNAKDRHIVRISPKKNKEAGSDFEAKKWDFISTTIHELRHLYQHEVQKSSKKSNRHTSKIKNEKSKTWYSEDEIDARLYEDQNIYDAVKIYDLACK